MEQRTAGAYGSSTVDGASTGAEPRADGGAGADAARGTGRRRARGRARRRPTASELEEKFIAGVPARIMRPRLVFIACLGALLAFGLLMVYSASSVEALSEFGSTTYYLQRQAAFVALGLVLVCAICVRAFLGANTWPLFRSRLIWWYWGVCVVLLALTPFIGVENGGAVRWIGMGSFTLQPSELAKPAIILVVSDLLARYYEDCSIDLGTLVVWLVLAVGLPLALIMVEPDTGTTIIIAVTAFVMLYLAGISYRLVGMVLAGIAVVAAILIIQKPYRITRFLVALDPWSDPYGSGYQATLAIMAFASGGLFGRGIGNSTMKYHYLPEAHNDYIVAIIGEELGMVGTVIFLLVYVAMIVAAFNIARQSPTLHGQLLASGCAFILGFQAFVNILGILSVIPMTGKTLPYISYGGSSMIASLISAGLIVRVSLESNVATVHDRRRAEFEVMTEQDVVSSHLGRSTAGEVHVRGRGAGESGRPTFRVYDGGAARRDANEGATGEPGRGGGPVRPASHGAPPGGYERINLNKETARDRLFRRDAGTGAQRGPDAGSGRSTGGAGGRGGYGRDEYDEYDR